MRGKNLINPLILVLLGIFTLFGPISGSLRDDPTIIEYRLADDPAIQEWLRVQNEPIPSQEDTFVTIRNGTIRGTTMSTPNNETIYAYLGIPYAAPPVGELRFQPPQQYNGWGGQIWDGTIHPHACAQFLTNLTIADEDCLFVSVYTRRNSSHTSDPLPVMYFIHGGGFLLGQTSYYTGHKLLEENVVLVSVQYRLGPLGFLYSGGDGVIPGNNGMKDAVQGLRWVQENIASFGGDPNRVTVFGESAGAASSIFMLTSPIAQGLFHGVAAMSGTSLAEWSIERNPLDTLTKLGTFLECDTTNTTTIKDCLMITDWGLISQAHFYILLEDQIFNLRAVLPGASVVIEGDVEGAFLTEEPLHLLETGNIPDVPVLLGTTQHEGSFLLGVAYVLKLAPLGYLDDPIYVRDHLIGDMLATWDIKDNQNGGSISQGLSIGFLPPGNDRTNFSTFTYELMDMISVVFMKAPVLRTADVLSRRTTAGVYLYAFEYYGGSSLWDTMFAVIEELFGDLLPIPEFSGGITHADDIPYMFTFPKEPTETDWRFTRTFCKLFTNFATHGNPTPEATPEYPVWPKYSVEDSKYMKLNITPSVETDFTASWRLGVPEDLK